MSRRYFSNTAAQAITTNSLNNTDSASTINLTVPLAGWPASTPFLAALEKGTATEEIVRVTAVSGSNVTVDRGYDNSPKRTHGIGATLQHVASAVDYDEANAHVNNSSGVHGVTGAVVGTTDAQTLSNKTLTQPTVGDLTNMQHDHSAASHGGAIPQAAVTGLTAALAALEAATSEAADITTVNASISSHDALVTHLAGTETITGAKTFSGGATINGGTVVGSNAANTVPIAPQNLGMRIGAGSQAFSYSSQSGKAVSVDISGFGFSTITAIQVTVIAGSNFGLAARVDSGYSTSSFTAWTFMNSGSVSGSFSLHYTVYGT